MWGSDVGGVLEALCWFHMSKGVWGRHQPLSSTAMIMTSTGINVPTVMINNHYQIQYSYSYVIQRFWKSRGFAWLRSNMMQANTSR